MSKALTKTPTKTKTKKAASKKATTKARKPAASLKSKTMKAAKPMKATKTAKASQSIQRYSWVHVRVPLSRPRRGFRWKDATPALVAAAEGSALTLVLPNLLVLHGEMIAKMGKVLHADLRDVRPCTGKDIPKISISKALSASVRPASYSGPAPSTPSTPKRKKVRCALPTPSPPPRSIEQPKRFTIFKSARC